MKLGENSSKHTFWATMDENSKQDCINAKMGRPIDSSKAWPPKGPLLDKWKEILPIIMKLVNEPTNNDYIFYKSTHPRVHLCELLLLGEKPLGHYVKPTIIVFCRQKKYAKRMVTVLQKSRHMSRMSLGFDYLPHDAFQHDVFRVAGGSGEPDGETASTARESFCGASITVVSSGRDGVPKARITTLGGVIEVNDQLYGMTTAHAVLGSPTSSESASSSQTDDSGEDEDTSDNEVIDFDPVEPTEDSGQPRVVEHNSLPGYRIYLRSQSPSDLPRNAQGSQEAHGTLLASHPDEESHAKPIVSTTNNVALLPLTESQASRTNQVTAAGKTVKPSKFSGGVPEGPVIVASGSSGVYTSRTDGVPRGIILPQSRQMLPCVTLEGTSVEGDSGSWVMDPETGDVHAMIVATSSSANETYCVPMSSILTGIEELALGGLRISLPRPLEDADVTTFHDARQEVMVDDPTEDRSALEREESIAEQDPSTELDDHVHESHTLDPVSNVESQAEVNTVIGGTNPLKGVPKEKLNISTSSVLPEPSPTTCDAEDGYNRISQSKADVVPPGDDFNDGISMKNRLFQKTHSDHQEEHVISEPSLKNQSIPSNGAEKVRNQSKPYIRPQSLIERSTRPALQKGRYSSSETPLKSFASLRDHGAFGLKPSDLEDRPVLPRQSQPSNRMRVHQDLLFPRTLDAWNLPWRLDPHDDNYIIIDRLVNEETLEELYRHTDMLRQRQSLDNDSLYYDNISADEEEYLSGDNISDREGPPTVIPASASQPKSGPEKIIVTETIGGREREPVSLTHRDSHRSRSRSQSHRRRQNEQDDDFNNVTGLPITTESDYGLVRAYRLRRGNRSGERSRSRDRRSRRSQEFYLPQSSTTNDPQVTTRSVAWLVEEHHDQAFLNTLRDVFWSNDLPREVCEHLSTQFRQVQAARREAVTALAAAGLSANTPMNAMNKTDTRADRKGTPGRRKDSNQSARSREPSLNQPGADPSILRSQLKIPEGPGPLQQPIPIREPRNLGPSLLRYNSATLEPIPGSPMPSTTPLRTSTQLVVTPDTTEPPIARLDTRASTASNAPTPKPRTYRNESIYDPATNSMILLIRGGRGGILPEAFKQYSDLTWEYSSRNPNDIIVRPWISERVVGQLMEWTQHYRDAQIRARIRGELPSDDEGSDPGAGREGGLKRHKSMAHRRRKSKWPAVPAGVGGGGVLGKERGYGSGNSEGKAKLKEEEAARRELAREAGSERARRRPRPVSLFDL